MDSVRCVLPDEDDSWYQLSSDPEQALLQECMVYKKNYSECIERISRLGREELEEFRHKVHQVDAVGVFLAEKAKRLGLNISLSFCTLHLMERIGKLVQQESLPKEAPPHESLPPRSYKSQLEDPFFPDAKRRRTK